MMSLTVPGVRAGVVAEMSAELTTTTLVAGTVPTVTVAGDAKSIPVRSKLVPPEAGPDWGEEENTIRSESSDVLPAGSVAVAVMREPTSTPTGNAVLNVALPEPSVVTGITPR